MNLRVASLVRSLPPRAAAGVMIGLLFLIGPANDLYGSSLGAGRVAAITVGLAVFVVLYAVALQPGLRGKRQETTIGILAVLALLPVAMLAAGAPKSFELLFVFFAAAAGMRLRPPAAVAVIALTAAAVGIATAAAGESSSATSAEVLSIFASG